MELQQVQGAGISPLQHQQQAQTYQNRPEQQPAPVREAEVNASASLQAYKQQSAPAVDTVQIRSSSIVKNLETVRAIEQMHSRLNELVKGVRETNEDLNKAAEQVSRMQGSLMAIIKNYPPYPIESMERRELLMSYMSLRKEIESLMVPPPPPPVYEKVKSMWTAMFAQNGQLQASAVPALESGSSDRQIRETADTLAKSGHDLSLLSDSVTQGLLRV